MRTFGTAQSALVVIPPFEATDMTERERKLMKIVMAPAMRGLLPLPTFDEWCAAFDELFQFQAKP